jgi:hypothetical protein
MLAQHGSAVGVGFTLPQNMHTCPLKAEVKSSDAGENAADGELIWDFVTLQSAGQAAKPWKERGPP